MRKLALTTLALIMLPLVAISAVKLPADKAGTIGLPEGKIAFLRSGNVWVMDADGKNQDMICESINADGRVSWAPDGRRIAFTRSGKVDLKGPDPVVGGMHKVYDIFVAWLDSAYANNRMWWTRLTDDLGSKGPEWSADGQTITFCKDMNANLVNASMPNYQICTMGPTGENFQILRNDWQNFDDDFLIAPTASPQGKIAAVTIYKKRPVGFVVFDKDNFMVPVDTIRARSASNVKLVAPAFSPDGEWLAYINNNINDGGLYIASSDLSEHYLVFTPPVGAYMYTLAPSFSPDSKWITFSTTDGSVWIIDITGNGARRLTGPGLDKFPAWSKAVPK
ncbi:MAG: hypothetical protein KOO62_07180 [candidate division Zixibacteria bacterium]|nr:hypothetical protein [candidate division Zixibacteria bacterium]